MLFEAPTGGESDWERDAPRGEYAPPGQLRLNTTGIETVVAFPEVGKVQPRACSAMQEPRPGNAAGLDALARCTAPDGAITKVSVIRAVLGARAPFATGAQQRCRSDDDLCFTTLEIAVEVSAYWSTDG